MLGWPNFGQNFDIFGLKSLKMAVFDVVLSKRHYETSWYFGFSYKIILFNGNFTFWIFKIPGWINFGRFWTFLAKNAYFGHFLHFLSINYDFFKKQSYQVMDYLIWREFHTFLYDSIAIIFIFNIIYIFYFGRFCLSLRSDHLALLVCIKLTDVIRKWKQLVVIVGKL